MGDVLRVFLEGGDVLTADSWNASGDSGGATVEFDLEGDRRSALSPGESVVVDLGGFTTPMPMVVEYTEWSRHGTTREGVGVEWSDGQTVFSLIANRCRECGALWGGQ